MEQNIEQKNTPTIESKTKPKGSKLKLFFLFVFLIMIIGCVLSLMFLWYGGYIKELVCGSVKKESIIWNKFNCQMQTTLQNNDPNKFPLEKGDNTTKTFQEEALIEDVVNQTAGSVVGIGITGSSVETEDKIIGTGFVISKAGLIVTNRHVVENETFEYFLMFKDNSKTINIKKENIFRDPVNDIALIKIETTSVPTNVSAIVLGDSDKIKLGQTVIAIGNPLGKYTGTITKGIISGINREVTISQGFFGSQKEVFSDVIQTDAAINPGNSGGPLINIKGEVVGINFATIEGASNMSFALPINRIKQRITELEENGKFKIPYLGVEYRTRVVFIKGQSSIAAEILNIAANSPASKSELKKGDMIIQFNGQDLNTKTLLALIQETKIGQKVQIVVIRNKIEQEISVEIGEK